MKKFSKVYLDRWYMPVSVAIVIGIIGTATIMLPSQLAISLSQGVPSVAFLLSILIGMRRLMQKEYKPGILQIVFTTVAGFIFTGIFSILVMMNPYNFEIVTIPSGLSLHEPVDLSERETEEYSKKNFNIYKDSEAGHYEYDVWSDFPEKGTLFLRAYEVTKKIPLSLGDLQEKTRIEIEESEEIIKQSSDGTFTIYEGYPGKPYAARFEVWFLPEGGQKAKKLMEKNYKIEK